MSRSFPPRAVPRRDDPNWCFVERIPGDYWCIVCGHRAIGTGNRARHRTRNDDHIAALDAIARGDLELIRDIDYSDLPQVAARPDILAMLAAEPEPPEDSAHRDASC